MTENPELLDPFNPVGAAFAPIIGLPAWFVQKGHGSILTFEFGEPHLSIREPRESQSENPTIRERSQRRRVVPHGEWHLFIYFCHWRCSERGTERSTDNSPQEDIVAATRMMDGQRLTSVGVEPTSGASTFVFDLGAKLETWPYADDDETQWWLSTPSGNNLAYRADGKYSWGPRNQDPDEREWLPLPMTR
jgi:hypothetical protein